MDNIGLKYCNNSENMILLTGNSLKFSICEAYFMKKVFPFLCLFALTVFSILPAKAYHWVLVGQGNYVDADSIRTTKQTNHYTSEGSGNLYILWTKYIADEVPIERMFGRDIWSSRAKIIIDCAGHTASRLSYYAYDAEGFVVAEYPKINEKILNAKDDPESPANEIFNFVCEGEYKTHLQHRHHTWRFGD